MLCHNWNEVTGLPRARVNINHQSRTQAEDAAPRCYWEAGIRSLSRWEAQMLKGEWISSAISKSFCGHLRVAYLAGRKSKALLRKGSRAASVPSRRRRKGPRWDKATILSRLLLLLKRRGKKTRVGVETARDVCIPA